MTARLFVALTLVLGAVALGHFAGPSGWATVGDAAQLVAGLAAAAVCIGAARARRGVQRRWRLFVAAGLLSWSLVRLWWVVQDVPPGDRQVSTAGEVGYLLLPLCLLIALLNVSYSRPRPLATSVRRDQIALLIDSVLIAGSLLALLWSALAGGPMPWAGLDPASAVVAVAYPIADLLLATMLLLVLLTRSNQRTGRSPLLLSLAAVLSFGAGDVFRLLALPGGTLTPAQSAGYLLGPAFLALAALSREPDTPEPPRITTEHDWVHLLLPYVPVATTGIVIAASTGPGVSLTPVQAYLGWLALGLVVARQMFTIVDNTVLIDRVSEGRRRLHHQAYHDSLTGLANRALFRERLVEALDAHRHHGREVAVLFADLDDFKLINDSYGHAMGDRLLHAVADRLRVCVPDGDLVARLGGDEFAVVLDHRARDAEQIGRAILAALREPLTIDGQTMRVGASIGLVVPEPGEAPSADALLRQADAAMYSSKRRGKGAMARYAGGRDGGPHADLPLLLTRALTEGEPAAAGFEVHYQPIVRLTDGRTVAVEALARWNSPAGPVHPDVFVTVAERTGLVAAIDDFVLDRACADMAILETDHGRPIDVHVNISAARLGTDDLLAAVTAAMARHGVLASRLVLEITETHRIQDLQAAAEVLERLRGLGLRVALDDFGSGFNALAQLHSLPVDIVKLDATLTDVDIAPSRVPTLCRSILAICTDLSITVIAEGIETAARAQALAELGFPLGQGYLFGQPGPLYPVPGPYLPAPSSAPPSSGIPAPSSGSPYAAAPHPGDPYPGEPHPAAPYSA